MLLKFLICLGICHSVFYSGVQGDSWGWSFGGSVGSSAQFQIGSDGKWHQVTGDIQGKAGAAQASNINGQVSGSAGALGGGVSGQYDPLNGWQSSHYGAGCTSVIENGVEIVKCDHVPK